MRSPLCLVIALAIGAVLTSNADAATKRCPRDGELHIWVNARTSCPFARTTAHAAIHAINAQGGAEDVLVHPFSSAVGHRVWMRCRVGASNLVVRCRGGRQAYIRFRYGS